MLHECGLVSAPVSVESLSGWLLSGKAASLTDMRFDLDLVGKDLLLEYDHWRTHKASDVERDVAKTVKLAATYPSAIVMRARIYNPVKLPAFSQADVSIVDVKTRVPSLSGPEVAKALAKYMDSPHKERLEGYTAPKTHASTDAVVHELMMKIDPKYRDAVVGLRAILGGDGDGNESKIVRMMNTHGLTERYDNLVTFVRRVRQPPYSITRVETMLCDGIASKLDDLEALFCSFDKLRDEFKIGNLQTFMCNGVAARLDEPEALYTVLRTLRDEFKIGNLQTFMCGSVAARLDAPDALYTVLRTLRDEFKIKNLQTFMCNGVAARLDKPEALYTVLRTLRDEFGNLQTFMCGGVAARLDEPEALYTALRTLRDDFKIGNLQTFMCNGVAARLDEPEALYTVLRTLRDEFKIKNLQTFMCNGVAARLDAPDALYTALRTLRDEFKIKNLQTFMCDGVAARLDKPEALYTVLRTLRDEFEVKNLQTFMCDGVAARLDKPEALYTTLRTLRDEFEVKNLASYVCNSIASKFDFPDLLFTTLRRVYDGLGRKAASVVVSGNDAFASRLYKPGFVEAVQRIGETLRDNRVEEVGAMRLIFDKNNSKLMDAIEALSAKLATMRTGGAIVAYLKSLKYTPGDKGRPVYHAALAELVADDGSAKGVFEDDEGESDSSDVC